jgi:hypothetical protein
LIRDKGKGRRRGGGAGAASTPFTCFSVEDASIRIPPLQLGEEKIYALSVQKLAKRKLESEQEVVVELKLLCQKSKNLRVQRRVPTFQQLSSTKITSLTALMMNRA